MATDEIDELDKQGETLKRLAHEVKEHGAHIDAMLKTVGEVLEGLRSILETLQETTMEDSDGEHSKNSG